MYQWERKTQSVETNVKKYIFILLSFLSCNVYAECVMRSVSTSIQTIDYSQARDILPLVTRIGNTKKCTVRYRIPVNNVWQTAEGESFGDLNADETTLCVAAIKAGNAKFIVNNSMSNLNSTTDMVCSDVPMIRTHNGLEIGTYVLESEVQIHPKYPNTFKYKNTICKWFVDTYPDKNDVRQYQGIICKAKQDSWVIVDKF